MPRRNVHGGKGFKKGKKGGAGDDDERAHKFNGRDVDQDYARVLRLLGNRRLLCFCNDGYERVGKIRGALCRGPRSQIIRVGDIVLISFREFEEDGSIGGGGAGAGAAVTDSATGKALTTDSGHKEIVDIMFRYGPQDLRFLRKEAGIHPALFGVGGTESTPTDTIFFDGDGDEGVDGDGDGDNSDLDIDAI
jgi:initiation factor 1A